MKGKALVSSLLAFALTVSMVTPAFAAGNATDVTLTVETDETPSTVSVKVPAVIPLHMDKQGVVSVEGDLKIENLSQESGVSVTGITVSGKSGWQVVDYSYDASAEPLNTEKIGMSFNGDPTTAGGSVTLTDGSWNISAQGQLPLVVDAKVPKRDAAPEQSSIAAVNWSFKVDEGGVVPPDESSAISNDWEAGSKMLTGGVRPVTFSWDSTAEDSSIVSVSAEDDGVVSVAASMAEMPYNGSATYNVTAKAKGTTKVTATLSTGETSEFTVEVCEVKAEGGGDITINVPGAGLKPGDKPGDITIDIPVTGPDGDTTITVKPEIPEDTTLNPGDNEIEVDVTVDGVTIHITIIIKVESDNPSDGLSQSVEEAQAMGFTFSPYADGLQIDSFKNKQSKSEINVPEQIGDFKVLKIGDGVFQGQSNMTKVTLPSTVNSLGTGVFQWCTNLTEVTIPDGVASIPEAAFVACSKLKSVNIPDSVVVIWDDAFSGSGIESIKIPDSVHRIGAHAFENCSLKDVRIPASVTTIEDGAFSGAGLRDGSGTLTVEGSIPDAGSTSDGAFQNARFSKLVIGDSATKIGKWAFMNNDYIKQVLFGNAVTVIDASAFYGCSGITSIVLPESLISIEDAAFSKCDNLLSVSMGDSVTDVGQQSFNSCVKLKDVTLGDGVKSIGWNAFTNCGELASLRVPDGTTSIGSPAFDKTTTIYYAGDAEYDYWGAGLILAPVIEGEPVEVFDYYNLVYDVPQTGGWRVDLTTEFKDAINREAAVAYKDWNPGDPMPSVPIVYAGKQVTSVSGLFKDCSNITAIDLSNFDTSNVVNMESMFNNCSKLTQIDLSNLDTTNVVTMEDMFGGCSSLSDIDVSGFNTGKCKNMSDMFDSCSGLTELDVSRLDTSSVEDMGGMFGGCTGLTELDLSSFDTSNVTNMASMFSYCTSLESVSVGNFDTRKVQNMFYTFARCFALTSLDLSSWDLSGVTKTGGMFRESNALVTCYGRTQTDCNKLNSSTDKPASVNFVVKP